MKNCLNILGAAALLALVTGLGSQLRGAEEPVAGQRLFELRVYHCLPGKLPDLEKRFRDHTIRLFQKHGMEIIGFWTPAEGPEAGNTLYYILAFPNREARDKAFEAFRNDPDWQKAREESELAGKIVDKVVSTFLNPTPYSAMK